MSSKVNLTVAQLIQIQDEVKKGTPKTHVAKQFNISARTVGRLCSRIISAEIDTKKAEKPIKKATQPAKSLPETPKKSEYVITASSVVLTCGSDVQVIDKSHVNYSKIISLCIDDNNISGAMELSNVKKAIVEFTQGSLKVKKGVLTYGEMVINNKIADRITALMQEGNLGFKKLMKFFERLLNNPSKNSVNQLWPFLEHNDVEIDEDGMIVGWKKVQCIDGKLFDSYTRKVPNNIGAVVRMPRYMVNDDVNQKCSQGLHVGAIGYVKNFDGDTVTKVLVDPCDVVSVPNDYNGQKMRTCQYKVSSIESGGVGYNAGVDTNIYIIGSSGEILNTTKQVNI